MRLVVEAINLQRVLSFVKGCVPTKSTLPILQHVLFCASGSALTVRGMTGAMREAESSCAAQIEDSALFTLPGKLLCSLVSGFPSGAQVGFARKAGDRIEMTCGSAKFTLRSLEPQDFPALNSYLGEAPISFSIEPHKLAELVGSVAYASEKDVLIRPDLYGVHLYAEGGKLVAVSSDTKRFARREIDCPVGAEVIKDSVLVGVDNLNEIVSALKGIEEEKVEVRVGPSIIEFATETSRMTSGVGGKPLEPAFKIPNKIPGIDFSVYPVAFREAVERCQQVYSCADKKIEYQEAKLQASDGKLVVSMGDSAMDTAKEEIEATVTEAKTLHMDVRFLAEMLRHWPEDGEMNVYHTKAGVYFGSDKHPDLLAVIQQLRAKRKSVEAEAA